MEHKQPEEGLFAVLRAELARYTSEIDTQANRRVLRFPPSHADRLGHTLFANLTEGGVSTLLVSGNSAWDPRSHYYESCRTACRDRKLRIARLFLVPHRHCRHDPHLHTHRKLDHAAGIATEILYIGDLLSSFELPLTESLEIGLWDDEVTCFSLYGASGVMGPPAEWRVSRRSEDAERCREVFSVLRSRAESIAPDSETDTLELEEPMITTAPVVRILAPVLCQGDHVSPGDCAWYHGVWQYLRIFNMVSTPTWHADFYLTNLGSLAEDSGFRRVLISGTADYSMLAHVLWAYRQHGAAPEVTVVDLCETPLFLCKWYAKLFGTAVSTLAVDIFGYKPETPFDVIATDAFITRFHPHERHKLLETWLALLRPGGRVVTTVRVESGLSGDVAQATSEQIEAFRIKSLQEARRWQGFLGLSPEEIATSAGRYAERMVSYSLKSVEELSLLFHDAGFDVETMTKVEVPGEMASTLYCQVTAIRR